MVSLFLELTDTDYKSSMFIKKQTREYVQDTWNYNKDQIDWKKNQIEFIELKITIIKAKTSRIRESVITHSSKEIIHPEYRF